MAAKDAPAVPTLEAVKPPKMQRGKSAVVIAPEVAKAWTDALAGGEPISEPGVTYDSRAKAASQATRIKKAVTEYADVDGEITSRVYSTNDADAGKKSDEQKGPFAFALQLRAKAAESTNGAGE